MWATAILPIASYPVKETVFSSIRKPFSSNNGNLFRDYITLVPLECESIDLDDLDRVDRIEFMNTSIYN